MSREDIRRRLDRLSPRAARPLTASECVLILPADLMHTPAGEEAAQRHAARLPPYLALLVLPDNGRTSQSPPQ